MSIVETVLRSWGEDLVGRSDDLWDENRKEPNKREDENNIDLRCGLGWGGGGVGGEIMASGIECTTGTRGRRLVIVGIE